MRSAWRSAAVAAVSMLELPLVGGVLGGGPDAIWSEGSVRGYGAGDLNGDGYDDVAIERDELEIHHGGPLGVDASTPSTTADIVDGFLRFGPRPPGDVNDDGYDDLIIADNDLERADVYHGGPGGISGAPTPAATLTGSDDLFAWDGRGAGDVDDDGYDDVIVTSPLSGAYVFNGSASGIGTRDAAADDAALLNGAAPNFFFTMAAGRAGDVNGDGYDDVLLVSSLAAVAVVHGSASGIPSGTMHGVADSIVTGVWGSGPSSPRPATSTTMATTTC